MTDFSNTPRTESPPFKLVDFPVWTTADEDWWADPNSTVDCQFLDFGSYFQKEF